jgi:HrpA-like RNA helicase
MHEFAVPELQRTPLEELCLQVRACDLAPSARQFLLLAPEPPSTTAIDTAIRVLQEVGALSTATAQPQEEGELTALGRHLAKLPLDVRLGKMLVLAALLRCLDPVLTVAAALSGSKSPLLNPLGKEQEARAQVRGGNAMHRLGVGNQKIRLSG